MKNQDFTSDSTHPRLVLTPEKLEGMSASEIRAVALDRGYRIGSGGRHVLALRFLAFQSNDHSGLIAPGSIDEPEPLPEVEKVEG